MWLPEVGTPIQLDRVSVASAVVCTLDDPVAIPVLSGCWVNINEQTLGVWVRQRTDTPGQQEHNAR